MFLLISEKDYVPLTDVSSGGAAVNRTEYPESYIYTLYEYRKRHATHKTDPDLQENHQKFPWIPVWDDHGKMKFVQSK